VQIPIACDLNPSERRAQLDEWRALWATSVIDADRVSPTRLSVRLVDDLGRLETTIRLAQREKACCPFFDFVLRIDPETITLDISVPEDATAILDGWPAGSGVSIRSAEREVDT
jgi:hypothetical protein